MHAQYVPLLLFSLALLCSLFIHPASVSACSCARPADTLTALANSPAVFSGKVLQVDESINWQEIFFPFTKPTLPQSDVTFEVTTAWKGVNQSQMTVAAVGWGGSCGVGFQPGVDYLVYTAYWNNQLVTTVCSRTTPLATAGDDLKLLGPGTAPTVQVDLLQRQRLFTHGIISAAVIVLCTGAVFIAGKWRVR